MGLKLKNKNIVISYKGEKGEWKTSHKEIKDNFDNVQVKENGKLIFSDLISDGQLIDSEKMFEIGIIFEEIIGLEIDNQNPILSLNFKSNEKKKLI